MAEQLRASVYHYLVGAGEKKAARALRKAHPEENLDNADAPSLEDLFNGNGGTHSKAAPAAVADHDGGEKGKKEKKKRKKDAEEEEPQEGEKKEDSAGLVQPAPVSLPASSVDAKKEKGKKVVERFQRVVAEDVEFLDPRLVDYSHESKGDDDWGNKANQILSAVRGKDFRHEKTKKKRGTYKGGRITNQVNSIKFDD